MLILFGVSCFSLLAQDLDGDGIGDSIDDNINVANGLKLDLTETDEPLSYVGNITDSYPDVTISKAARDGKYGSFEFFSDGRFEYSTISNTYDTLVEGATISEVFEFPSDFNFPQPN